MIIRRRMILQLTSLVDLLFIVMFLQYMELQDASEGQVRAEAARRGVAETARRSADRAREQANQLKESALASTSSLTQRVQSLKAANDDLQHKLDEATRQLASRSVAVQEGEQRAARELNTIAEVVQEMIGINPEALKQVLKNAPEDERNKIRKGLEEMKTQPHAQLVQHLRETAELQKYTDIWEVHIYEDASVSLRFNRDHGAAPIRFFPRGADELSNRVVAEAKGQGEPRSLVIVCLTWANADLRTRDLVNKGLTQAVTALKPDWGGSKRIELAKLGFADNP